MIGASKIRTDSVPLEVPIPKGARAKALGAYYTPDKAVDFMVRWAVRQPNAVVIDPSFGNGQFLKASTQNDFVQNPKDQIYGIELDKETFDANKEVLETQYRVFNLYNDDFFDSDEFFRGHFGPKVPVAAFDAVVGNPPFIRYQRFKGQERERALKRALEHGVTLPGHASSWAPFLVHAVSLIKPGGRLAMVVPSELGYAAYAKSVMAFLLEQFGSLSILSFQRRLFPKLGEDTLIVLGDDHGSPIDCFELVDVEAEERLAAFNGTFDSIGKIKKFNNKELESLKTHQTKLLEYLLSERTRTQYRRAVSGERIKTFGNVVNVGIGYVTGHNDFFHPDQQTVHDFGIPDAFLKPCVRRSNNLQGLHITEMDWSNDPEPKKWLLHIPAQAPETLPKGLRRYLEKGEREGVLERYKVSHRERWYSVPHVKAGDALLTYMSGGAPRLIHNPLGYPAPNSLHTVTLRASLYGQVDAKLLVVAWYTSLTFLSAEIEGHSLGGGMLKLEPSEAKKVLIALPDNLKPEALDNAYGQIDSALRQKDLEAALDVGDVLILQGGLGYSPKQCSVLRSGYHYLRDRRMNR